MDDAESKFKFFFNQSAHFHRSIFSFRNFSFSIFSVALKKCTVNKSIICSSIILGRSPRNSSSSSLCRNGFKELRWIRPRKAATGRIFCGLVAQKYTVRGTRVREADTRVAIRHARVLAESKNRLLCSKLGARAKTVNRIVNVSRNNLTKESLIH